MKRTRIVIIAICICIAVIVFFIIHNTAVEPLDNVKIDVLEPGRSGLTSVVSLNTNAVDLSGGTTSIQYEPEVPIGPIDDTIRYNSDNFDLTYHELNKNAGLYETNMKNIQVWDPSSKSLVLLPYAPAQNLPVYYDIEKRVYGPFRPTYADSVLLGHYR